MPPLIIDLTSYSDEEAEGPDKAIWGLSSSKPITARKPADNGTATTATPSTVLVDASGGPTKASRIGKVSTSKRKAEIGLQPRVDTSTSISGLLAQSGTPLSQTTPEKRYVWAGDNGRTSINHLLTREGSSSDDEAVVGAAAEDVKNNLLSRFTGSRRELSSDTKQESVERGPAAKKLKLDIMRASRSTSSSMTSAMTPSTPFFPVPNGSTRQSEAGSAPSSLQYAGSSAVPDRPTSRLLGATVLHGLGSPERIVPIQAAHASRAAHLDTSLRIHPQMHSNSPHIDQAGALYTKSLEKSNHAQAPSGIDTRAENQQVNQSVANRMNRKFHQTSLQSRVGRPYTTSETIMIGYLAEKVGLSWNAIDKKMARGHNTCATKHTKQPHGLKYPHVKARMRWEECSHAIDVLLKTIDLDMEQLVDYLQRFIDTGMLPKEAADEFDRTQGSVMGQRAATSFIATPRPMSTQNSTAESVVHDIMPKPLDDRTQRQSQDRRSDNTTMVPRLRPNARLFEGQLHIKSMFRRDSTPTVVTPDSLLESDPDEDESVSQAEEKRAPSRAIFDIEYDDEYGSEAYVQRKRPYLSLRERKLLNNALKNEAGVARSWLSVTIHEDFRLREVKAVEQAIITVCPKLHIARLVEATRAEISAIASCATLYAALSSRTRASIQSFLKDTAAGQKYITPQRVRIGCKSPCPTRKRRSNRSIQLLKRECGFEQYQRLIKNNTFDSLVVTRRFIGASGDVGSIAWSPSGQHFAAGSACLVDSNSMQYNRPNNLLLGNLDDNVLYELPDHHSQRQKTESGANSTHSMHTSQDSRLFETVSMVDFARDGSFMFSVGYDSHLRAYDTRWHISTQNNFHYDHGAKIDLLSISQHHNLLATGCAHVDGGIKLFQYGKDGLHIVKEYTSPRAKELRNKAIIPSALKWGTHHAVKNYLLAGFSTSIENGAITTIASGDICLWDIEHERQVQIVPAAGNTFDCAWSHGGARFATAVAAYGTNLNRGTKSLIRVYDPLSGPDGVRWTTHGLQLECPALDVNDVVFSPYNQDHITAGATDGSVYVWDIRRPDHLLHRLSHGNAVMELDEHLSKEKTDTGVRFCSWGHERTHLYTGSSDGILKVWDIHRSPENVHQADVATFDSGVMSGAFNQDCSALLIGEVNGSFNLLEVEGEAARSRNDVQNFKLQSFMMLEQERKTEPEDSGVAAARSLLRQRVIETRPFGGYPVRQAVQGRNYAGPFDRAVDAPNLRQRAQEFQSRLTASSASQCTNLSCQNSARYHGDEASDSERWKDRVPQAMRDELERVETNGTVTMMLDCAHCGAPARVRENDLAQAAFPCCERCAFACLRCGESIKIGAVMDKISCRSCSLEWDIGALGYKLRGSKGTKPQPRTKENIREEVVAGNGDGLNDLGDLLHLVEDYYHSLWDRRTTTATLA